MGIRSTVHAANAHVTNLAYDPIPIPGFSDKLNTFGGWAMFLAYSATAIALIAGGGYIAWDKITDHGGGKGVKIAIGSIIGTAVVSSAASILTAAQ